MFLTSLAKAPQTQARLAPSAQQHTARDSNKTLQQRETKDKTLQQQETKDDRQGSCQPTPSCAHTRLLAGLCLLVPCLATVVARALAGLSLLSLPSLVLDSHDLIYSLYSHHMPLLAGNEDERFLYGCARLLVRLCSSSCTVVLLSSPPSLRNT